jgi:hypothetical protein
MASRKIKKLSDEEQEEFLQLKDEIDKFDMDNTFGGYVNIKRTERLERALKYKVISVERYERLKSIMEGKASSDEEINRRLRNHCDVEPTDAFTIGENPETERYWAYH